MQSDALLNVVEKVTQIHHLLQKVYELVEELAKYLPEDIKVKYI